MPRIATIVITSDENDRLLCMINTHLDYQIPEIQIRQLKKIYEIIKRVGYAYPIVLMGDFNLELSKPYFKEFVDALNNLGLQRVEVNDKTNASKYSNKTAIDHIFIPQSWLISEAGLINHNKLKRVTDHKGVYVKIKV